MKGNGHAPTPKLHLYGYGDDARFVQELTPRQLQVLRLAAQGLENKGISLALNMPVPTVRSHLSQIYQRLNVTTRTQAIFVAYKVGIFEEPQMTQPQTAEAAMRLARYYMEMAERLMREEMGK